MDLDIIYINVFNINFQYIQYIKIIAFTIYINISVNKMT